MSYPRPTTTVFEGPDLAGEMAAALAAASIVFLDDAAYSKKLVKGAETAFAFARDFGKRSTYSRGKPYIEPFYNSSGYFDEYMWGGAWLYFATGNTTYISLATNPDVPKNSKAFYMKPDLSVLSWDNKLPAAMLLLTRVRMFLNPGYPYEDMLSMYHNVTSLTMCSYLHQFNVFKWTNGNSIMNMLLLPWFFIQKIMILKFQQDHKMHVNMKICRGVDTIEPWTTTISPICCQCSIFGISFC